MNSRLRQWFAGLFVALGLMGVLHMRSACAHELTMVEMNLREVSAGQFIWSWSAPGRARPVQEDLAVVWPEGCRGEGQAVLCGEAGLRGTMRIDGVGQFYSAAMVRITWLGGEQQVYTFTAAQPRAQLFGSARDERSFAEVGETYLLLGVEHILSGYDHLLFVVGLMLLVGLQRRLALTISAFTLAHSLTLAASALDWLTLRPAPVEACIALSIVLVAVEALNRRDTLSRRWPAVVAFLFGLVHGLGFAGALKEIGLPQHHITASLLSFNLGVEAGQLLVVLFVAALILGWRRFAPQNWTVSSRTALARSVMLYLIGSVAAYWSIDRMVAIWA